MTRLWLTPTTQNFPLKFGQLVHKFFIVQKIFPIFVYGFFPRVCFIYSQCSFLVTIRIAPDRGSSDHDVIWFLLTMDNSGHWKSIPSFSKLSISPAVFQIFHIIQFLKEFYKLQLGMGGFDQFFFGLVIYGVV